MFYSVAAEKFFIGPGSTIYHITPDSGFRKCEAILNLLEEFAGHMVNKEYQNFGFSSP